MEEESRNWTLDKSELAKLKKYRKKFPEELENYIKERYYAHATTFHPFRLMIGGGIIGLNIGAYEAPKYKIPAFQNAFWGGVAGSLVTGAVCLGGPFVAYGVPILLGGVPILGAGYGAVCILASPGLIAGSLLEK